MVASGIQRRFGCHVVLRNISFEVVWGEAVALVGPNGAGKSTFLRIAAGVLTPHGGGLRFGGACMQDREDAARMSTALLAGDSFLYEDLTALENLRFAVRMSSGDSGIARLMGLLEQTGLAPVADARVRDFSSGMRKRLALARVVAMAPPVLLLDEPYVSLDEDGMRLVDAVVSEWSARGRAVVMATHFSERARLVCDRVLPLVDGVILADERIGSDERAFRLVEVGP